MRRPKSRDEKWVIKGELLSKDSSKKSEKLNDLCRISQNIIFLFEKSSDMETISFVMRKEQAGSHCLKQQLVKSGQYITLRLLDSQLNLL